MNACLTTGLMQQFHRLFGVLVLFLFSLQVMATEAPVVVSVDYRVVATFSKPQFDARKGEYTTQVRIKNRSAASLLPPLRLTLEQFDGKDVKPLNAEGAGKDSQPYFEFALPKGKLAAGGVTEPIKVVFAVRKNKDITDVKERASDKKQSPFTYHVRAGVEVAPLEPSAFPNVLSVDQGKVKVLFTDQLVGVTALHANVYLRRVGDKESIEMNDQGIDGDLKAKDGVYGVNVLIDTAKLQADTCDRYEVFTRIGRTQLISPATKLCVSSFPVRGAVSDITHPLVFPDGSKAVADEIIITVKENTSAAAIRSLAKGINAKVVGSVLSHSMYQLKLPTAVSANRLVELITQMRTHTVVETAWANGIVSSAITPTDTQFSSQHGLKQVLEYDALVAAGLWNTQGVWDSGATGNGVSVIVMDSGIYRPHSDFGTPGDCQLAENDCGSPSTDIDLTNGHGTQVAGVIAAKTNNGTGVAGVAYGSKIHSIVWGGYSAPTYYATLYQMIDGFDGTQTNTPASINSSAKGYIATHPQATVINVSYSGGPYTGAGFAGAVTNLCAAINNTVQDSLGDPAAVVVVAAGNNGADDYYYPARCKNHAALVLKDLLITVASSSSMAGTVTDPACGTVVVAIDQLYQCSNHGDWVDIVAPGVQINTTATGGGYVLATGTSVAAPLVSGAAAILKSCGIPLGDIRMALTSNPSAEVWLPVSSSLPAGMFKPRLDIYNTLQHSNLAPTGVTPANFSVYENVDTALGYVFASPLMVMTAANDITCGNTHTLSIPNPAVGDQQYFDIGTGANAGKLMLKAGVSLNHNAKPIYTVTVRVTDFWEATFDQAVEVNVLGVNHSPAGTNTPVTTNEDTAYTFSAANFGFTDPLDLPPNNLSTVVIASLPAAGQLALSGVPVTTVPTPVTAANLGNLTFMPAPQANGVGYASFTFQVVDDGGLANGGDNTDHTANTLTINVTPVIDVPSGVVGIDGIRKYTTPVPSFLHAVTSGVSNPDSWSIDHYQWRESIAPPPGDTPVNITIATNPTATSLDYQLQVTDVEKYMSVCAIYSDPSSTQLCSGTDTAAVGDPHITTVDGLHYDFQSAGEFVALRNSSGLELQVRQSPVSTASPLTDAYSGLTSGVSVNSAIAARVGKHRVTYQADANNNTASGAPVLRVDGVVTSVQAGDVDLGDGGRVTSQGNGIQIDFPDQTTLIVSTGQWVNNVWWMHLSVYHTSAYEGIMGARLKGSWLPRLSDGSALGVMPASLHDRYVQLYEKFADSWRVTNETSLFDYAKGTSTATFTNKAWPTENGPYVTGSGPVAQPLGKEAAVLACGGVMGKNEKADCVFDVRVMGHKDIAKGHLLNQKIRLGATNVIVRGPVKLNERGDLAITATVARHAMVVPQVKGLRNVPAGTVQFMLGDKPLGKPVRLDEKGQAKLVVKQQILERFNVGKLAITARYLPTKDRGNVFLPSISRQLTREVVKLSPVVRDVR